MPQAFVRTLLHASNQPCQSRHAGQQHLVLEQSRRSKVEQNAGGFGSQLGAGIKKAHQTEKFRNVRERFVTILALNFSAVVPLRLTVTVTR